MPSPFFHTHPFCSPSRKRFTREEIRNHILDCMLADPQPNGKQLSQRLKSENENHLKIANYFNPPEFTDEF